MTPKTKNYYIKKLVKYHGCTSLWYKFSLEELQTIYTELENQEFPKNFLKKVYQIKEKKRGRPKRKIEKKEIVKVLLEAGFNQSEIAKFAKETRQNISLLIN